MKFLCIFKGKGIIFPFLIFRQFPQTIFYVILYKNPGQDRSDIIVGPAGSIYTGDEVISWI